MLSNASFVFPDNTPMTKEAYYYRTIFEKFFPKVVVTIIYSKLLVLVIIFNLVCFNMMSRALQERRYQEVQV